MKRVKIFGLMRSGTNYAEMGLKDNFEVEVLDHLQTGSKHAAPELAALAAARPDALLVCVKDPLAWLVSIHQRMVHRGKLKPGSFKRWLGKYVGRDGNDPDYRDCPLKQWHRLTRAWLDCKAAPVHVLRSEDVLHPAASVQTFAALGARIGLKRRTAPWKFAQWHVRAGTAPRERPFARTYYRTKHYLKAYTPALIAAVRRHLDPGLMVRLGYAPAAGKGKR